MRTLLLGIDSGTQSTKVLVVDARDGKVIASAAQEYDLIPNLPPGAKEQHPHTWRDATAAAMRRALRQAKAAAAEVKAIGVSGQQHGFVPLDKEGQVIRPAKLWCDTSTAAECEEITEKLGGFKQTIRALGNAVLPGFTASKILWLKKHEPKNYAAPGNGALAARLPESSGSPAKRPWNTAMPAGLPCSTCADANGRSAALRAIDPELAGKLPPLMRSDRPAGTLQASTAKQLDLNPGVLVSAGGGDNMMGAIGTGNTRAGVITASFGTSGTIYACAEKPVVDPQGEIAAFCDSTNRWLPLLCTMNVTVATEMVREDFGWSHEKFAAEAAKSPGRLAGPAAAAVFRGRAHAQRAGRDGRLVRRQPEDLRGRPLCPRGDGRRDAGHELRPAPAGGVGRQTDANPRYGRRRQVQGLAADHGRCLQRGGGHPESQRRRGLRRRPAGALVLALAAG